MASTFASKLWGALCAGALAGGAAIVACSSGAVAVTTPDVDGGLNCGDGAQVCGGACATLARDPANCGACGNACKAGQVCSAGTCATSCGGGTSLCAGSCTVLSSDGANCGACANACKAGEVCSAGKCASACSGGTEACGQSCVSTQTDRTNCGACGTQCKDGEICTAGKCALTCQQGLTTCGGRDGGASYCASTQTDNANCGACGNACPNGQVCAAGKCATSCGGGSTQCGNLCVDVQNDPANCGACGNACGNGLVCAGGVCQLTCLGGSTKCGNQCVDTRNDPANCGACNTLCSYANAGALCANSLCGLGACSPGFANCNNQPIDGCEIGTTTDPTNCGGCGVKCAYANAGATCGNSSCGLGACNAGYANCNNIAADGCEIATSADVNNCGACGNKCGNNATCVAGACKSQGLSIAVEGHANVNVNCVVGDYSCQAQQVCNQVTNSICVFQQYDCAFGNQGSWYPPDGLSGGSNFNFAYTYDLNGGSYGNICACTQSQMTKYGLASNHTYCGLGHWTRQ